MSALTREELLAIMTAGARLSPERSRALSAASYRDPAQSVELAGDKSRRCGRRRRRGRIKNGGEGRVLHFGRPFCSKSTINKLLCCFF